VIFTLLLLLTIACLLVPTLPALIEWRRPTDVQPLLIDETDALDPTFLAQRFSEQLREADEAGAVRFNGAEMARWHSGAASSAMPLTTGETASGRSARAWRITGDARFPAGLAFDGEAAISGDAVSAAGGDYRGLWVGGKLSLAEGSALRRFAHGASVEVGPACRLEGRVTAGNGLAVASDVTFTLLHAPTIDFIAAPDLPGMPGLLAMTRVTARQMGSHWPASVRWDASLRRGLANGSLAIDAAHAWQGDLVCLGNLSLAAGCQIDSSLKARGDLRLGMGCRVTGSVFAEGAIHLAPGCEVLGAVVSETALTIGDGCVFGAPGEPTTVAAPTIRVGPGVLAHGTVWAGESGRTASPPAASGCPPKPVPHAPPRVPLHHRLGRATARGIGMARRASA
jgi:hypothetical protein